jgi:hypothetical protein
VWKHPLIGFRPALSPIPVTIGQTIRFDTKQDHANSMHGWSSPENWGVWSEEETASILLHVSESLRHDLQLHLTGHAFVAEGHPSLAISMTINNHLVGKIHYDQQTSAGTRIITIPSTLLAENTGRLFLQFTFDTPKSPIELGISTDERRLGLGLESLRLEAQ